MLSMSSSKLVVPTVTNTDFMTHRDMCGKTCGLRMENLRMPLLLALYLSGSSLDDFSHLLPGYVISPVH